MGNRVVRSELRFPWALLLSLTPLCPSNVPPEPSDLSKQPGRSEANEVPQPAGQVAGQGMDAEASIFQMFGKIIADEAPRVQKMKEVNYACVHVC